MANNTDKCESSLCGLQDMLTDFDGWLCRYRQYCIRSSNVSASLDDSETNRTQRRQLYINSLLIRGYIHDKLNQDCTKHKSGILTEHGAACASTCDSHLAGVSWGKPDRPAVLLVHGYMDSAATFLPLIKLLPEDYYYVAIDMPGHGRSDPFPVGPVVSHTHQLEAARRVVEHLGWTSFIFISHSVGFIIGVLYNAVYPGRIKRMVHIDPVPPLTTYCYHEYDPAVWFNFSHEQYYEHKWDVQRNKTFSYEEAVKSVMTKRKVNRRLAEVLLSRSLVSAGKGTYRFSWEPTMKKIAGPPLTEDFLYTLMKQSPPTLNIVAQDSFEVENVTGVQLIKKFADSIDDFLIFNVVGTHDVHVTNPERFSDAIIDCIQKEKSLLCKL